MIIGGRSYKSGIGMSEAVVMGLRVGQLGRRLGGMASPIGRIGRMRVRLR